MLSFFKGDDHMNFYKEKDLALCGSYNPYIKCPKFETEHFILRLVKIEDAISLLKCYSDPKAQEIFNSDRCTSDFCYHTLEEMKDCIDFWLKAYEQQAFVRFAILDKSFDQAVGTIEMFGGSSQGILRLDICSEYEEASFLKELFMLCAKNFFILFGVDKILTKAVPIASDRTKILSEIGFNSYEISEFDYYWMLEKKL